LPDAVEEMMARSGGFNVPADYFRSTAMPVPVPASPRTARPRWPLYATIGAVGTLVGVMGVVIARSSNSRAQTPAPAALVTSAVPVPVAPPAPPPATNAANTANVPAAAATTTEVVVSITPSDTTITRDGANLGRQPIVLHLPDGTPATLVLSRKGYKTKTVTVDAAKDKQEFALDPVAGPRPAAAKPAGGIDDVGDPFAAKR
jgi:serine/threonine-protein kinase